MLLPIMAAIAANSATTTSLNIATRAALANRSRKKPKQLEPSGVPDCDDPDVGINKETN